MVEKIILPDANTLSKNERGDWVCYYKQGSSHAADFHKLLEDSGIVSFGASNYKNNRKVYYVTKAGGVFSIDKKDFTDAKSKILNYARFISDTLIGKSLEDEIKNAYEIKF